MTARRATTLVGAVVLAAAAVRTRLLDMPLDRDEGEYAYMAQLLLQGTPPYAEAYNMKMPGIYAAYAMILALLGESAVAVRLGLVVVTAATSVLVFLLARRLLDAALGVVAAALYATLALSPASLGLAAYAEHFVSLAVVGGTLLLVHAVERNSPGRCLAAGLLFGLAFVLKQSGGLFAPLAGLYVVWAPSAAGPRRRVAALAAYGVGALLPLAGACAALAAAGTFETFWFWTVLYAPHYAADVPFTVGLELLIHRVGEVATATWPLWLAAGLGLATLRWSPVERPHAALLLGLTASAALAVSLGLHFRHHYFLLLAPAQAILGAAGVGWLAATAARARRGQALAILASLVVAVSLWGERAVLFQADAERASRAIYGTNPFVESVEIARYIEARTTPDDRIFVVGSEPQIYFYARRRAASGYIYMYPLMERHPYLRRMQQELFAELEAGRPRYLVYVGGAASWLASPRSDTGVAEWFRQYWPRFEPVGIVEIRNPGDTTYSWDADARRPPRTPVWLGVYRRRDETTRLVGDGEAATR